MEIAILAEPAIFSQSEIIDPLKEKFLVQKHDCGMGGHVIRWIRKVCKQMISRVLVWMLPTCYLLVMLETHSNQLNNVCSHTLYKQDYLAGGAKDATEALEQGNRKGYQHLDRLVVVFEDPKRFLRLLERVSVDNDDYPALESWLARLRSSWQINACQQQPRIVLVLHQVKDQINKEWNEHRRRPKPLPPPSDAELHDAITWLLIQFQVECIHCSSLDSVAETLQMMTRALSEESYRQQVTELECIKKIKAGTGDKDNSFDKAKDCWTRQLQQVPQVSETKAFNVAREYPTARSLWEAYQDENKTLDEKRLLLSNILAQDRQHSKLSDSIYRLMTSTDPNQLLL